MADDFRKFDLDLMGVLLTQVNVIFRRFRKGCEHRDGVGCSHKDYHRDFALANICKLGSCPVMEEGD